MVGVVSNIVVTKKYGFISCDNGQEYFFHKDDMLSDWDTLISYFGEHGGNKIQVNFEPVKTPKGPRAKDVSVIEA